MRLKTNQHEKGGVFLYILLAIGLLGILTFTFMQDQQDGIVTQRAQALSQELYSQLNMAAAEIIQCTIQYPAAVDLNGDGDIDADDNPNPPWPLNPMDPNNPAGAAAANNVHSVQCPGAPVEAAYIFEPENRAFPSHPGELRNWFLVNTDASNQHRVIIGFNLDGANAASEIAADMLEKKYNSDCRIDVDKVNYAPEIRVQYYLYQDICY